MLQWSRSGHLASSQLESNLKATESPQMSLFSSMLALIPQSGDFSGATLGVRSVALLQVPKLTENFTPDFTKM